MGQTITFLLCLFCSATTWADDFTLASFNIRIFSTGSRDDAELALIADRLQPFDLIAIQEVRDEEVVHRTLAILAGRGFPYRALVSDPVGRGVKERCAFLWREEALQALDAGQIWPDSEDHFIREPYIASFRAGQFDFTLVTMHSIYGDAKADRRAEALLLDDVYAAVQEADPGEQDVILLGDFNLPPEDQGFAELATFLTPLFTGNRYTTISENAKSLYDNIWFDPQHVREYAGETGIDDFDVTVFGNDDKAASLAVSDHRPVWATFHTDLPDDDASSTATAAPKTTWGQIKQPAGASSEADPVPAAKPASPYSTLIDINTASQVELEALPGVGPVIAQQIIAGRPYETVDELIRVKGIGKKKMAKIRPLVKVE